MNILIIIAVALAALKLWKRIPISWTVIMIIGAAGFILPALSNAANGFGGLFGGSNTTAGTKDACGCGPDQKVTIAKKGWFGYKNKAVLPCSDALVQLTKKKMYNLGCVNS